MGCPFAFTYCGDFCFAGFILVSFSVCPMLSGGIISFALREVGQFSRLFFGESSSSLLAGAWKNKYIFRKGIYPTTSVKPVSKLAQDLT